MSYTVPLPSRAAWINVRGSDIHLRQIKRRPADTTPAEARRDRKKRDRRNRKAGRR